MSYPGQIISTDYRTEGYVIMHKYELFIELDIFESYPIINLSNPVGHSELKLGKHFVKIQIHVMTTQ